MTYNDLIRKKRDGGKLSREEIYVFIQGYLDGLVPDYQMSALLMAIYFRGMDFEETTHLTDLMIHSGETIDLSSIPGIKVDKHSTGGVGDKVSLILAPIVAACGVPVPMMSGRGLGHSGGTLDKLESIPGFRSNLSIDEYKKEVSEIGIAMIGQTTHITPADKRIYALRDVTSTIDSIPLIAGSIISKKVSEGTNALVLDVKTGLGAFMKSYKQALELAKTLVAIGTKFGIKTISFITDMSQPLGNAVGNWLEVAEVVECLRGRGPSDLMEVTNTLSGAMVMIGKKAETVQEGIELCKRRLASGDAYEKFINLIKWQGGDISYIEKPEKYPPSKFSIDVRSSTDGHVVEIDALEIGLLSMELGAGRTKIDDVIDPKAGILFKKKVGNAVHIGDVLATFFTDKKGLLELARARLSAAFKFSRQEPPKRPLIISQIDEKGVNEWSES
jgi:pyrimidine-nucleoside phosphorylase